MEKEIEPKEDTPEVKEIKRKIKALDNSNEKEIQILINKLSYEDRADIGRPLKHISQLSKFEANGNDYIVHHSLSINRYEIFEDLQENIKFAVDARGLFQKLSEIWADLEAMKIGSASVKVHNLLVKKKEKIKGNENDLLMLCALFIARPGEDLRVYNEQLSKDKIADWRAEGIPMTDFFELGRVLVENCLPD